MNKLLKAKLNTMNAKMKGGEKHMSKLLKTMFLIGAIVVLVPAAAFAAGPLTGWSFQDFSSDGNTIDASCGDGDIQECGNESINEDGMMQRLVRDDAGNYFYQTIIVSNVDEDPACNNVECAASDRWFVSETFVGVTYGYDGDKNEGMAGYQRVEYEGTDEIMMGMMIGHDTFESTFEVVTGVLYDQHFTAGGMDMHMAVQIDQQITDNIVMTMAGGSPMSTGPGPYDLMDSKIFDSRFQMDHDHGSDSMVLAITQDVSLRPTSMGGSANSGTLTGMMGNANADKSVFRFFEIENPTGSGTMHLETDFNGIDATLTWDEDAEAVTFLWVGQTMTPSTTDANVQQSMGVQTYGVVEQGGVEGADFEISAHSYTETGPWHYVPHNDENPFVDDIVTIDGLNDSIDLSASF